MVKLKIVRFKHSEGVGYGVLEKRCVYPVKGNIFTKYEVLDKPIDVENIKLLSPINPGKIIAVGLNYFNHVGEFDFAASVPEEPIIFLVANTAVIGPDESIKLCSYERRIDHEGELVTVIGKECTNIEEEEALDYVFGYTCGNDVSDRDIQKKDGQWTRGKSYPTFKPLGPWIETELDPNDLDIQTFVNGELKQNSNTKYMIFSTANLVSFLSKFMTLYPGDVIMTGTPEGVGPIKRGDVVEVKIEGIGVLRNPVE